MLCFLFVLCQPPWWHLSSYGVCTLAGVPMFSVMWSELTMTSATSCPPWSSVHEWQRVECAPTSPVRTEYGMGVMYFMQCRMSVSAIVICLVLLMCTLTIWRSVLWVLMVEDMSVVVNVMLSLMSVMSPPPTLCNISERTVVKLCTLGVFTLGASLVELWWYLHVCREQAVWWDFSHFYCCVLVVCL